MNTYSLVAGLMLLAAPSTFAGVEVFTASHIPMFQVPSDATVVELDALAGLDEQLGYQLPTNLQQAERIAQQRLQSPSFQVLAQRYEQAAMTISRAWMLRINKIPAVVVNGQYVVYGQPNVAAALALIAQQARP